MPASTVSVVREQIATGAPDPVYLLLGEDEVEKAALAHEFEELVEESLRPFNVDHIHGLEATTGSQIADKLGAVLDAARTLPMMAPRRVVVVWHAEGLLAPKRESEAAARAMDGFEELLKTPPREATLVLVAGAIDKRVRIYKTLARQATIVECGVLESEADAERWVRNRVAAGGAEIEPAAARLIASRCGTDIRRLRNDVERLLLYALGQKRVSLADARELVGPAALQDDWAMTNALASGDTAAGLRQLALLLEAGAPPEKVLGQLAWFARDKLPAMAPARVRPAIDAVFRTDSDLKRTAGDPRVLLERLVVELGLRRR
jgi:DNA polymerase-3 subunit delta